MVGCLKNYTPCGKCARQVPAPDVRHVLEVTDEVIPEHISGKQSAAIRWSRRIVSVEFHRPCRLIPQINDVSVLTSRSSTLSV
jgi:hypothetical protein